MSQVLETVKVKTNVPDNEQGYYLLNKSDFIEGQHELFVEGSDASNKPEDLTATQIKEQLKAKGIEFKGNASRTELLALLDASNKPADPAP